MKGEEKWRGDIFDMGAIWFKFPPGVEIGEARKEDLTQVTEETITLRRQRNNNV